MIKYFFSLLIFLLSPFAIHASTVDLGLDRDSISFSEDKLITGDSVRIYASVKNLGDVDISGYVLFYQGDLPLGNSQVISVRTGGVPEEVYVDFVVPTGSFNIRADIKGTDPEDENTANNSVITKLYTPILDDDRDGVENEDDNCSSAENSDQKDTDVDGLGDVCDDDDDGDGVTDSVEKEIGTDPKKVDTDGDGLPDASDPHPTIPESQVVVTPPSAPVTVSLPEAASNDDSPEAIEINNSGSADILAEDNDQTAGDEISDDSTVSPTAVVFSPKAVFSYESSDWNSYHFKAQLPVASDYRVTWNFGDNVTSNKNEVDHVFQKSGDYTVQMKIEGPDGSVAEDSVVIHVPFFSFENQTVQFLLGFLIFVLLVAVQIFFRIGWTKKNKRIKPPTSGARKLSVRQEDNE